VLKPSQGFKNHMQIDSRIVQLSDFIQGSKKCPPEQFFILALKEILRPSRQQQIVRLKTFYLLNFQISFYQDCEILSRHN